MAKAAHWLPGEPPTVETLGTAQWLDDEYWKRMEFAVANGISRALKG